MGVAFAKVLDSDMGTVCGKLKDSDLLSFDVKDSDLKDSDEVTETDSEDDNDQHPSAAAHHNANATPATDKSNFNEVGAKTSAALEPKSNVTAAPPAAAFSYDVGANHNQDELKLVSLGCYCGPKLSFRKLGRDAETLPFDWCRTRIDGLVDFLQNNFDKFFHHDTKEQVSFVQTVYRSYYHSFWHDDLSKPADIEKLRRRIARFQAISAHCKPVLFVRAVANDEEVQHLRTLCDVLIRKFGRFAKLLAIVDFQAEDEPLVIQGYDNLLVYKLNASAHNGDLGEAPYVKPIAEAIQWAKTGKAEGARSIQSLSTERFDPGQMGWICATEPFETVPKGGMKRLPPAAGGAMNLQSYLSNNLAALQPASVTPGSFTPGQGQSLSAGGVNWSMEASRGSLAPSSQMLPRGLNPLQMAR
jgi:hypothetical protein